MAESRLQVVGQETAPDPFPVEQPKPPIGTRIATDAIALALTVLSQRAIAAVKDIFTLASVGSAFWLFLSIRDPDPYQLVELAMFAAFILAANWIVRRR